jgi:ATP-binding protein involved in chromosome partitioning
MRITKWQVQEVLKQVIFFKKQNNIVDLEMVHNIDVSGKDIALELVFPDLADPAIAIVGETAKKKLKEELGDDVQVSIKNLSENEVGKGPLSGVRNIIAVISGKGGVGKSTVSANLAVTLARMGKKVGILDADIMGPSVPIMFGVEGEQPAMIERNGKPLMVPLENYGVRILSLGFFVNPEQALMWRGSMINKAFNQLMSDTEWGDLDYLIVDMPPGTGDIQLTLAQSYKIRGTLLVTTPQKVAVADVRRAAMMYRQDKLTIPLLGIVENMSYFSPEDRPEKKYYLFGKGASDQLAEELDIPILGRIPIVERIVETGDSGSPITLDEKSPVTAAFRNIAANVVNEAEVLRSAGVN